MGNGEETQMAVTAVATWWWTLLESGVPPQVARRAEQILHALVAAGGEIEDRDGHATRLLIERAGLGGTSAGPLHRSIRTLEHMGFIEREVVSTRTYAIRLGPKGKEHQCARCPTPQELTPLSVVREPDPEEVAFEEPLDPEPEAGFDYDELARRVLAQVLNQTVAAEEGVIAAQAERAQRLELETKLAQVQGTFDGTLARKEQEWRQARDEITGAAEAAIKDAERIRDALKVRVEEQDEELETLRRALEKYKAKAERTERGLYPLREHLRPEGIAVLERLMKQPPGDKNQF